MSLYRHTYGQEFEQPYHSELMGPAVPAHAVQFYEDDAVFIESLSDFVGASLGAGGACIVIATHDHHRDLTEKLINNGIDVPRVVARAGTYILMRGQPWIGSWCGGSPDRQRFNDVVATGGEDCEGNDEA